jgi:hypothetical protein
MPTKKQEKISVLYMLYIVFLERKWKRKHSRPNGSRHSPNLIGSQPLSTYDLEKQ